MKRITAFIFFSLIIYSLAGCYYSHKGEWPPSYQQNTTWISEDGNITIVIDKDYNRTGTIRTDDETIAFLYSDGPGIEIELFYPEAVDENGTTHYEYRFEYWKGKFHSESEFTATVVETTYFTVGEKISFYRVDDETE